MTAGAVLVEELRSGVLCLVDLDLALAAAREHEGKGQHDDEGGTGKPGGGEGGQGPGILSAAVRAPAAILFACAAIALAACSNDQKPGRTIRVSPGTTVQMTAKEYRFDPGRIIVRGHGEPARLRIVLSNRGTLAHNLHIRDGGRNLAATRSFKPGGRQGVALNLPPGTYDYLCTVADHDEKGMTGKIEVR